MSAWVTVTPLARDDIKASRDFYESRRPGLGMAFVDEVLGMFDRVAANPLAYGEFESGVRAVATRVFGHVVYYRGDSRKVEILAVLHGGRSTRWIQSRI